MFPARMNNVRFETPVSQNVNKQSDAFKKVNIDRSFKFGQMCENAR